MNADKDPFRRFLACKYSRVRLARRRRFPNSPKTSPLTFHHKHLSSHLVLKRILPLPQIPEVLSRIADDVLESDFSTTVRDGRILTSYTEGNEISSLNDVASNYGDAFATGSQQIAFTFLLTPQILEWQTLFVLPVQPVELDTFSSTYELVIGNWGYEGTLPHRDAARVSDLRDSFSSLASWQMLVPTTEAETIIKSISTTTQFGWKLPSTIIPSKITDRSPPPDSRAMPWTDLINNLERQGHFQAGRLRSYCSPPTRQMNKQLVSREVRPGRKKKSTAKFQVLWQEYVQELWCHATERDSTFIIFHCGTFERIGIRHRRSQTLYISDPIHIMENANYGKIQMGLHLAIVQDVLERMSASKQRLPKVPKPPASRTLRSRKRPSDSSDEHQRPTKRKKTVASLAPPTPSELETQLLDAAFLLIDLDIGCSISPKPTFFSRNELHGASAYTPSPSKSKYLIDRCLQLQVTSKIGTGATGDVYKADLFLGEFRHASVAVALKFALSDIQQERLVNEAWVYSHLQERSCDVILPYYGLFISHDGDAMALVLGLGGDNLSNVNRFSHPSKPGFIQVPESDRAMFYDAVESIHDAGVLHRDLRPPNLLISEDGTIRIIDFDRAKLGRSQAAKDRETAYLKTMLSGDAFAPRNAFHASSCSTRDSSRDAREAAAIEFEPEPTSDDDRFKTLEEFNEFLARIGIPPMRSPPPREPRVSDDDSETSTDTYTL